MFPMVEPHRHLSLCDDEERDLAPIDDPGALVPWSPGVR